MESQLKAKLTMFKRWFYILSGKSNTAIRQDEGKFYKKNDIAGYYNNLMGKVSEGTLTDEDGIPITKIGDDEVVHFPIAIFQYGLGCYDCYLDKQENKYLDMLRVQADWAVKNQEENGSWNCFGPLKSSKYTVSSMGQGEGASMLLRAYKEFGDKIYYSAAKRAVDFMLTDMESGGTALYDGEDIYLEEYPQIPKRSVMNGWIFSLFGLYDMAVYEPETYKAVFEKSVQTLSRTIDEYDCGYWSYYDLEPRIASPAYHDLHIALLNVMHDLTDCKEFKAKADKFKIYQSKKINKLHAVLRKLAQKLTEKTEMTVIQ